MKKRQHNDYIRQRGQRWLKFLPIWLLLGCDTAPVTYESLDDYPIYSGSDLGLTYSPKRSIFRLWAPTAEAVKLRIYNQGSGNEIVSQHQMKRKKEGIWELTIKKDLIGKRYTFEAVYEGQPSQEVPDPYAKAVGVNGLQAAIIDLAETNPAGWNNDSKPPLKNFTDAVIYELHIRDLSIDPNSGIQNKGKFLGLAEKGTQGPGGVKTGLDHLVDLGITHVHLLPSYDFASVDESRLDQPQFNWGYDPQNYNVPEGSYSTDPDNPVARIKEFKQMVKTLHENGLRVVMDVVYNHTFHTENSLFNQLIPDYYYRHNEDGSFSDASACGNEIATERPMVRKMILESVLHWTEEYHIDGFRFDLMGIMDIETMNIIRQKLDDIDPSILIYGEGWTASSSPYPETQRALKKNTTNLVKIAAFSDDLRDGIKGHWSDHQDHGMVSGKSGLEESVKFGVVAATQHPQVDYSKVNYSDAPWAPGPEQCINYASCHDDLTLWDKLAVSNPEADEATLIKMHKLSNTIVLTSQGIPLLHAGVDFLRTKGGNPNSFKSPDAVNQLDWSRKAKYIDVHQYYKDLIALRRSHPAFRMAKRDLIQQYLEFLEMPAEAMVGFKIAGQPNGEVWKNILVIYNGNPRPIEYDLPDGNWTVVVNEEKVDENGLETLSGGPTWVEPISPLILAEID